MSCVLVRVCCFWVGLNTTISRQGFRGQVVVCCCGWGQCEFRVIYKKERAVVLVCSNPCVVSYFIKNKESLASHGRLKDVLGLGVFDELCAWRLS